MNGMDRSHQSKKSKREEISPYISSTELSELKEYFKLIVDGEERIKKAYGLSSLEKLTASAYPNVLKSLQREAAAIRSKKLNELATV